MNRGIILWALTLGGLALALYAFFKSGSHPFDWDRFSDGPGGRSENVVASLKDLFIFQGVILAATLVAWRASGRLRLPALESFANRRFVLGAAAVMLVICFTISWKIYEHQPRDVDSVARVFQARTFSSGRISVPVPREPSAMTSFAIIIDQKNDRFYSKYSPGAAAVYAVWYFATGTVWGVNAVLASLTVLLLFSIAQRCYGKQVAVVATALLVTSPFFLFMCASLHSHVACMFFGMAHVYALVRAHETRGLKWFLLAGAMIGLAFATRPFTGFLIAIPSAFWVLVQGWHNGLLRRIAACVAGAAVPVSLVLLYNAALTGDPLTFPFHVYAPSEQLGFGHLVHGSIVHTPIRGLEQTGSMLWLFNNQLLGWPFSLLPLGVLLIVGDRRRVDALATFPGGIEGEGLQGLRQYIRDHREDDFVKGFSSKLLAYALGRSLALSDDLLIREIGRKLDDDGHRFETVIESIVTSRQFLNKRGREHLTANER